jgi:hypothetical protein
MIQTMFHNVYTIVSKKKNVTTVVWYENLKGVKFANYWTLPTIIFNYVSSRSTNIRLCRDKIDSESKRSVRPLLAASKFSPA